MWVCVSMYGSTTPECVQGPLWGQRGHWILWNWWSYRWLWASCRCWEVKPCPLQERQVLLTRVLSSPSGGFLYAINLTMEIYCDSSQGVIPRTMGQADTSTGAALPTLVNCQSILGCSAVFRQNWVERNWHVRSGQSQQLIRMTHNMDCPHTLKGPSLQSAENHFPGASAVGWE